MSPEDKACQNIDQQLQSAGCLIQDMSIMAGLGVAVREFQPATSKADDGLYIDGKVAGAIEAKHLAATQNTNSKRKPVVEQTTVISKAPAVCSSDTNFVCWYDMQSAIAIQRN